MEDPKVSSEQYGPRFPHMSKTLSFNYKTSDAPDCSPLSSNGGDFEFTGSDRRFAFSRQASFQMSAAADSSPFTPGWVPSNDYSKLQPFLSRTTSSIDIPPRELYSQPPSEWWNDSSCRKGRKSFDFSSALRSIRFGSRPMKRLFMLISLNVAYSTVELCIGLFSGRVGLVSDAFHLTFGCGILTFSLFAMAFSREKPNGVYTYGYKRPEVLSAFTNALFLLFLSFSLAVEALHAFIQDESEHQHYLIVSAVTNLMVNLIGVWFFRSYARVNLVYRKAEDMNYHSVCLHVLADSIRSAGLILASWLLALGVKNAEVLCLGLVSITVFMLVMPLFTAAGGILLQMSPTSLPSSALSKCWRQVTSLEDVQEFSQSRLWELVPGHIVGSLSLQVKKGADDSHIIQHMQELFHDLGVQDFAVQIDHI